MALSQTNRCEQSGSRKRRQERIDLQMRELNRERTAGKQRRGRQCGLAVRHTPRDPVDHPDRGQVEEGGQKASGQIRAVVSATSPTRPPT